jgi:hypothetical protein
MRRTLFLLAAIAAFAPSALAQGAFMPYLGYNFDTSTPTIGVAARFQPAMFPVAFQPGVEVTLDDGTNIQADINAVLPFGAGYGSPVSPWVGAGAAVLIPDDDFGGETSVAANFLAGASLNSGFVKPFVEGRLTKDFDFAAFSAHLGALFNF